jgi:hypothetical protein
MKTIRVWAWNDWLKNDPAEIGNDDITNSRIVELPDGIDSDEVDKVCEYLRDVLHFPHIP